MHSTVQNPTSKLFTTMSQNELKRAAASAAIEQILPHLLPSTVLGIGTGSTTNYFIDALAAHKSTFSGAVASSEGSAERLASHGIKVFDLNQVGQLHYYVDGADEVNSRLHLIKGGGAALTREKIVAACSEFFICIVDASKCVDTLGDFPLPLEIIPMAKAYVIRRIAALGASATLRKNCVTDNGNHILDVTGLDLADPIEMESVLNNITGVVSNGIFAMRPADLVLAAKSSDGRIEIDHMSC